MYAASRRLAAGEVVTIAAEPTPLAAVNLLDAAAVGRLRDAADGRDPALVLRSAGEAFDFAPSLDPALRSRLHGWWPGPVELRPRSFGNGLLQAAPSDVRSAVTADGRIRLRRPAGEELGGVLRLTPAPLVAVAAENSAAPHAVVEIDDDRWRIVAEGDPGRAELEREPVRTVVFVCTGNTCRSPLAAAVFRVRAAETLGCGPDELEARGLRVLSAGLAAGPGSPASRESVELARKVGGTLRSHRSRAFTDELLDEADRVYVMTDTHRRMILHARPDAADRVALLAADGADIPDPIGGGLWEYEQCLRAIEDGLRAVLDELDAAAGGRTGRDDTEPTERNDRR